MSCLFAAGCSTATPEAEGILNCPGDHTPVVDWGRHEALGCNPAKDNKVTPGGDCSSFRAGARTTDVTGAIYECGLPSPKRSSGFAQAGAAQAGLVWIRAKYPEPTEGPNAPCARVGDFARAPDGSIMRCAGNGSSLPDNGAAVRP